MKRTPEKLWITPILLALFSLIFIADNAAFEHPEKIIFLHYWTGAMSGGIDAMVEKFNRDQPEYRVRATGFEHETFKVSIKAMLRGGRPPDLFSYWAGARVQALVDAGYLAPIDDLWNSANLDDRFPKLIQDAATYNGRKYIIPVTQHYVCFFYNKRIFGELSLRPPTDWREFLSTCKALRERGGVDPIALGSREKWPAQFWFDYLLLGTAGPDFRNRLLEGRASYTDPAVKRVFSLWKELLESGSFNSAPNLYDWSEASKMVFHGKAAMTLMGTWVIGLFDGKLGWRQETDYDFFAFPILDPSVPVSSLGPVDAVVLPKEGKFRKAQETLRFFSDTGPQKEMSKGSGALSPNKNVPQEFYTGLQRRILSAIDRSDNWAFAYDLSTPHPVAETGLDLFYRFIAAPESRHALLEETQRVVEQYYSTR